MSEVIRLPGLGALHHTAKGKPRKRERPVGPQVYYTVLDDEQAASGRNAYLAHAGGTGGKYPGHPFRWGHTALHELRSEDPLHLEPSIGWQECCGRHGFIRGGVYTPTADSLEPV